MVSDIPYLMVFSELLMSCWQERKFWSVDTEMSEKDVLKPWEDKDQESTLQNVTLSVPYKHVWKVMQLLDLTVLLRKSM